MSHSLAGRPGHEASESKSHASPTGGIMASGPGKSTLSQPFAEAPALGGVSRHAETASEPGEQKATGGLSPGASGPDVVLGGGDPAHAAPAAEGAGAGAGSGTPATPAAPAATPAHSISTTNTVAAQWLDHGQFKWWVGWRTDGRTGWIVQKITNTYSGTKGTTPITNASVGTQPSYYESWAVSAAGAISPSAGSTHDMWERPSQGTGSRGTWSMRGEVYWTAADPAASGHTPGGASNAGILVSGTSAPAGIGSVLMTRNANGAWDSTGATPTHTGSAA